ncbi:hypothetical protein [Vibrio alfacsensis]|uniref:hypothetical protein n=1 Tax=Vibrio alfacsensis TaxID=1074311 RepID=UPI004067C925
MSITPNASGLQVLPEMKGKLLVCWSFSAIFLFHNELKLGICGSGGFETGTAKYRFLNAQARMFSTIFQYKQANKRMDKYKKAANPRVSGLSKRLGWRHLE